MLGILYTLLVATFGLGVWVSGGRNWPLRVVGALLIASGIIGLAWPPMHQRAVLAAGGGSPTDIMHIVWSVVTVLLFMLEIQFGASALGERFRLYSVATTVILVVFGVLTFRDAPRVGANLPTPWIGVWERINIGVYLLWVVVLAVALLPVRDTQDAPMNMV